MPRVDCQRCSKEFYVKPNHQRLGYGKYCSRFCTSESLKTGKYIPCKICNKKVWRTPKYQKASKSGNFFCGKSCQTKWRNTYFSGERHPLWIDGGGAYREIALRSNKKQICRLCKTKDKRVLIVHHIDKNRKNNNLHNLAWLCHNCHFLVHHHEDERKRFMVGVV